jgi:hypothetical protein
MVPDLSSELSSRTRLVFGVITGSIALFVCGTAILGYELYKIDTGTQIPFRVSGSWIERDGEIGYVPRPNNVVEFYHPDSGTRYHAFTDQRGARVTDRGEQTPSHADLMFIGCSFTWGLGVINEDTYAAQTGRLLGVSTVNLGMGGYSSIQSLLRLRRNLDSKPRVVIYGFLGTHLERNVSPCAAAPPVFCLTQPYFEPGDDAGHIHPPFAPLEGFEAVHIIVHDWHGPGDMLRGAMWAFHTDLFHLTTRVEQSKDTMTASIRFAIAEMEKTTRSIGAKLLIVHIPMLERPADPPEALRLAIRESGVRFVDVTPAVRAHYRANPDVPLVLSPVDSHPNRRGHRLIAEEIVAVLGGEGSSTDALRLQQSHDATAR